jgi:twitching motility two-component system response regulator PilG
VAQDSVADQEENPAPVEDHLADTQVETHEDFTAESGLDELSETSYDSETESVQAEMTAEETPVPQTFPDKKAELMDCPFCCTENEQQAFTCRSCQAVLSLSDLEMLLSQENADKDSIKLGIEKMKTDKNKRGVDIEELKYIGIGYINLKKYRKGFEYLQEASQKDQNDVMLSSQIDALAIRISEIEAQAEEHQAQPKSKTILVVDDSPTVRKLITSKLEKSGHTAIGAVDGIDALSKLNELIPDLILLDITMPRMDGYQVCKQIRGNEATKDVPVVMISGKDGFFDKVRGKMAGTDSYITKPFGPETLMKMVNEYIS